MVSKAKLEEMIDNCSKNNQYILSFKSGLNAIRIKDKFVSYQVAQAWICPYLNPLMVQEGLDCEYAQHIYGTKYFRCNARK